MAKKGGNNKNNRRSIEFMEDKTSERYFSSQLSKASKLYDAEKYDEAIKILEPLTEKYRNRVNLLELLGISYAAASYLTEARDTFEQALAIAPGELDLLTRFNLAQLYVLTGYNFLGYEQAKLVDCYDLARETKAPDNLNKCRDFKADLEKAITGIAEQNGKTLDEFLDFALALDNGRLALSKYQLTSARHYFSSAADLNPKLPVPFNNLALVCLLEGDLDSAEYYSRRVLDKLDAQNRIALSNLVRVLVAQGNRTEAEKYLDTLTKLPETGVAEDMLKLAEAHATLDNDEAVLQIVEDVLDDETLLEDLDAVAYEELVTFGVIAAANLGQISRGLTILRTARKFSWSTLLERTLFALENNERGPRPGGRFFYYDPVSAYPAAAAQFQNIAVELDKKDTSDYRVALQKFYRDYGGTAFEVAAYKFWIDRDPELVADLLAQALASGTDGAEDFVRRLAFSRAGDDLQRLTAAKVLIEAELIPADAKLKIWLGQRQALGTLTELRAKYNVLAQAMQAGTAGYESEVASLLNEALDNMRRGDRDGAIRLYRRVLERNPNVKQAYQNLAALLSGKGEMYSAIEYLQQALKVDPNYTFAQIALAQLRLGVGQLDEAEAGLNELRSKLGGFYLDEIEAYYGALVALYQKKEQPEAARAALDELLALDPDNAWAKEVQGQLTANA
jgi:Flp pilus assembly protein TadD